jgi:hypothetical protein
MVCRTSPNVRHHYGRRRFTPFATSPTFHALPPRLHTPSHLADISRPPTSPTFHALPPRRHCTTFLTSPTLYDLPHLADIIRASSTRRHYTRFPFPPTRRYYALPLPSSSRLTDIICAPLPPTDSPIIYASPHRQHWTPLPVPIGRPWPSRIRCLGPRRPGLLTFFPFHRS